MIASAKDNIQIFFSTFFFLITGFALKFCFDLQIEWSKYKSNESDNFIRYKIYKYIKKNEG